MQYIMLDGANGLKNMDINKCLLTKSQLGSKISYSIKGNPPLGQDYNSRPKPTFIVCTSQIVDIDGVRLTRSLLRILNDEESKLHMQ